MRRNIIIYLAVNLKMIKDLLLLLLLLLFVITEFFRWKRKEFTSFDQCYCLNLRDFQLFNTIFHAYYSLKIWYFSKCQSR